MSDQIQIDHFADLKLWTGNCNVMLYYDSKVFYLFL